MQFQEPGKRFEHGQEIEHHEGTEMTDGIPQQFPFQHIQFCPCV